MSVVYFLDARARLPLPVRKILCFPTMLNLVVIGTNLVDIAWLTILTKL